MISRCSLTTLLLINTLFVFAQKERALEGVWKTADQQDSLIVCVSGQSNAAVFVYFPTKAKFLPFSYAGTELTHMEPDGSKLVLNVAGETSIVDAANPSGKKTYAKASGSSPVNLKTYASTADDFFDLSTANYYAGINFYLSTHPGLPFIPNPAFIAKRKLSTIKIEKTFARVSGDGSTQAQKEYDLEYNFNSAGYITTVKVIPYNAAGQDADTWNFNYEGNALKSVKSPGRVLDFDKDNWEVDARQQKKVPFVFPMWTYYGNNKPRTAILPYMTGVPLNEYFYDDANGQLVKICSKDVSEPNIIEHCTSYYYDGKGIPNKIIEMKRSK